MLKHFDQVLNLPSPTTQIKSDKLDAKGIKLFIKRDDLIHAELSGNKWRKLHLNLAEAQKQNKSTILTFGGAYSNHIYATAAACNLFGFKSIGIIRGEMIDEQNPTLKFGQSKGMEIVRVSKEKYKHNKIEIAEKYPDAFCIPEGGNNQLGRDGMADLSQELVNDFPAQKVKLISAIGTGCTFGGLINFLPENFELTGINVLKNLSIDDEVKTWLQSPRCQYKIMHDYHFGGYAKANQSLVDFINDISSAHKIQLDPIYTSKTFFATFDLIDNNYFQAGDTIVVLHTGGLQGIPPFNQRYGKKYGSIKLTPSVFE